MVAGRQHPPITLAGQRPAAAPAATPTPCPSHVAADVLSEVRRAKSEAKRSMRTAVTHVAITDTAERLAALERPSTTCAKLG